jgi:prevent-host-death family protein
LHLFQIIHNFRKTVEDALARTVTASEVNRNFGKYHDQALVTPVRVVKYRRASVVIVSAAEYERLRKLDRKSLAVEELRSADIAAIKSARIPRKHRYKSAGLV